MKQADSRVLHFIDKINPQPDKALALEFFFYADSQNDASNLAITLHTFGYRIEVADFDKLFPEDNKWIVSGWTTKMKTDIDTITEWTARMETIAKENNCMFDGWGTFPIQDDLNPQDG